MNKAKLFFIKEYNDEKMLIHSECVIEACVNMVKNTNLNKDIFIIAGWVHDMGKKEDKENHHEESIPFLHKFLEQNPEYKDLKEELEDCVLNHRSKGKPKTIYGLVFKAADKVALNNKRWFEFKKQG